MEIHGDYSTQAKPTQAQLNTPSVTLTPNELSSIEALLDDGRPLDAYEKSIPFGSLKGWQGVDARVIASRLANHNGSYRLSDSFDISTYRKYPEAPEAQIEFVRYLLARHSPLAAWNKLKELPVTAAYTPRQQASRISLQISIAKDFRDFNSARNYLDILIKLSQPEHLRLIEEAELASAQDQYETALDYARQALSSRPRYVLALDEITANLVFLGRNDEALELLQQSIKEVQSLRLLWRLIELKSEQNRHDEVLPLLDLYEHWSPLIEKRAVEWLSAQRADAHYYLGNTQQAIEWSEKRGGEFYEAFAQRLRDTSLPSTRKTLPVAFVRQHYNTCAPATLSCLANYWGQPIPQEQIAGKICYHGTTDSKERSWALENGFTARDFKLTWETAQELINRGIPFALATAAANTGHLQAVIGYDIPRRTLIIRDPSDPSSNEYIVDGISREHAATGPRCMLLLPPGKLPLADSLSLPESEGYDLLYKIKNALDHNDREAAVAAHRELETLLPSHRLTWYGAQALAFYDRNIPRQLECANALLEMFPDNVRLQLQRLSVLLELGHTQECRDFLGDKCSEKNCHPLFRKEYATALATQAENHRDALRHLLQAHRYFPQESTIVEKLAEIHRIQRKLPDACDLYRFASCLDHSNENVAGTYFSVSRQADRIDPAIDFLRQRFHDHGRKDYGPARTLFNALEQLELMPEAFQKLEEALTLRPDDEWLLLFACSSFSRYNRSDRASELLARAEPTAPPHYLYRIKACMSRDSGRLEESLGWWRKLLDIDPTNDDARTQIADLLAKLHGNSKALEFVSGEAKKYPHDIALHQLWYNRVRDHYAQAEPILRHLVQEHPTDVWSHHELAHLLRVQEKNDEAMLIAEKLIALNPCRANSHYILGEIHRSHGNITPARDAYHKTLQLDIDFEPAIDALFQIARSTADKRNEADFILAEMHRQTVWGDGFFALRRNAQSIVPADQLLGTFEKALRERPDLWLRWSITIAQLTDMRQLDKALELSLQALERFPLVPALHRRHAHVLREMECYEEAATALRQALTINPAWTSAVYDLCEIYRRTTQYHLFRTLISDTLVRLPKDARLHGFLAEASDLLGEREAAIKHLSHALELDPDYEWGWKTLCNWITPEKALPLARQATEHFPHNVTSWFALARVNERAHNWDDAAAAYDRAIFLLPRNVTGYDMKAYCLTQAGRLDEALQTCSPSIFGQDIPGQLLARAAWITAEKGHRQDAIRKMRQALEVDPENSWGWTRLADWLHDAKEYQQELHAIDQMIRLGPTDPVPLGYRADARAALQDKDAAMADLRAAVKLDPKYGYGWTTLFRRLLEDNKLEDAEKLLPEIKKHLQGNTPLLYEALFYIRKRQSTPALDIIRKLCCVPDSETYLLNEAFDAYAGMGARMDLESVCYEALQHEPGINPRAGALWAQSWSKRRAWDEVHKLNSLDLESPSGQQVLTASIEAFADSGKKLTLLLLALRHRKIFATSTPAWGAMGYALVQCRKYIATCFWLRNWKQRPDVRPWMLCNLIYSFAQLRMNGLANRTICEALTLPRDHTYHSLLSWKAYFAAHTGNFDEARKALAEIPAQNEKEFYGFLARLARWLVEVSGANDTERRSVFKSQRNEVDTLFMETPGLRANHLLKRYWIYTTRASARNANAWLTWIRSHLPRSTSSFQIDHNSRTYYFIVFWILFILLRSCSGH